MEIERRGKFPGIKVHLDKDEVEMLKSPDSQPARNLVMKLSKKISKQLIEDPSTLQQRSQDEIRTELETERDKAIEKLAKLSAGKQWSSK